MHWSMFSYNNPWTILGTLLTIRGRHLLTEVSTKTFRTPTPATVLWVLIPVVYTRTSQSRRITHIYKHVSYEELSTSVIINQSFKVYWYNQQKKTCIWPWTHTNRLNNRQLFLFFLTFGFCRFCVVIRFFHPRHSGQWPPTSKDFYTRYYPLHYFLILILEKEPVFPFSMLSAKLLVPFYNVFGMTRSLTGDWTRELPHSKPALYHIGYRGGGPRLGIEPGSSRTRSQHSTT